MQTDSSVYERISETNKYAVSKRSRIIVFLLSFITPVGIHNIYLGHHIRGIIQIGFALGAILFIPPLLLIIILPFYIAWITSEGLTYLLWYKVKDGDDFKFYDKSNPPLPKKRIAILLAFLLPFGLHNFYLGRKKMAIVEWGLIAVFLTIKLIYLVIPVIYISFLMIVLLILPSWLEGLWLIIKKRI